MTYLFIAMIVYQGRFNHLGWSSLHMKPSGTCSNVRFLESVCLSSISHSVENVPLPMYDLFAFCMTKKFWNEPGPYSSRCGFYLHTVLINYFKEYFIRQLEKKKYINSSKDIIWKLITIIHLCIKNDNKLSVWSVFIIVKYLLSLCHISASGLCMF